MPQLPASRPALFRTLLIPPWAAVLAGGLIGSAARFGVAALLTPARGGLPTATLIVNLFGSLLLGFYLARREHAVSAGLSVRFWGIGVFGSYTTFSAFGVEVVQLLAQGEAVLAGGYVAASMVGGLLLTLVGGHLGAALR